MATKRDAVRVKNVLSRAFHDGRSRIGVHGVGRTGKVVIIYHRRPNVKKISKKIAALLPDLQGVEIRFEQEDCRPEAAAT